LTIRTKIIAIFIPVLFVALLVTGIISSLSARSGMTRIAIQSMGFKSEELKKYAENQWSLLVENNFSEIPDYVSAAQKAVSSYAQSIVRSDTELIFALNEDAEMVMTTSSLQINTDEKPELLSIINRGEAGWVDIMIAGHERVGHTFFFVPFNWFFFVTDDKRSFYREIRELTVQNGVILIISCIIAVILILIFSQYLTRPLKSVVNVMKEVISHNDLSKRAMVEFPDEIGRLAHQFNTMTAELEYTYNKVRSFAAESVLVRKDIVKREYETLTVLGKAAEYKDPETGAHIMRVGLLSRLLAKSEGEDEQSQNLIYYAAPLHDIGKLGIPDTILLKPGKLTNEEFEIIKTHTQIAYEILKDTQSHFLQAGATIALTHHEKFDGTGYPYALKGEDIPLYGRIVGLIDVFDALTSKRPYKEPWPFEKAVDLVKSEKTKHFDPTIVDLFLENIDEVKTIYDTHKDNLTVLAKNKGIR
jgi:response regulator RpfG family c-di-GMP phosphodiesterase